MSNQVSAKFIAERIGTVLREMGPNFSVSCVASRISIELSNFGALQDTFDAAYKGGISAETAKFFNDARSAFYVGSTVCVVCGNAGKPLEPGFKTCKGCTTDTDRMEKAFVPIDAESAKTQPMLTLSQASMLHYMREAEPVAGANKTNEELIASMTDAEREEFESYV